MANIDLQQTQSQFNFIGTLLGLLGVWLGREICTIGSNGGVVGLWKYFWFGIKPGTIIDTKFKVKEEVKNEGLQQTNIKTT